MKLRIISLAVFSVALVGLLSRSAHTSNAAPAQQATMQATSAETMSASTSATMAATMVATLDPVVIANTTLVRVIHASPNSPDVDIYLDKGDKPAVSALAYGKATDGYLQLAAGNHDLKITAAGDAKKVVFEATLPFQGGTAITFVAEGLLANNSFRVRPYLDDVSPTRGLARVKVIHAIPDGPAVDVASTDFSTIYFSKLAFGGSFSFDATPNTYDLVVVPTGKRTTVIDLKGTRLEADTLYTVIASGTVATNDKADVKPLVFVAPPVPGFAPLAAATAAPTAASTAAPTAAK